MQINQTIDELLKVTNQAWGRYVLESDEQFNRINPIDLNQIIGDTIECGINLAKDLKTKNTSSIEEFISSEQILITTSNDDSKFYSLFENNTITLYLNNIEKINNILKELDESNNKIFNIQTITQTLLAFELFYFLEKKYENSIYTKTKHVTLVKVFKYEYSTKLSSLSRLAAASFAKEILGLEFQPLILDVIFTYLINKKRANLLSKHILYLNKYFK